jgi:putative transposase
MDLKRELMRDWEVGEDSIAELSRRYGISRQTAYKWRGRYQAEGVAGLEEQSRAPEHCRWAMSAATRQRILGIRREHPRWGPRTIRAYLEQHGSRGKPPAASTIGALLLREGLIAARARRRRTPLYSEPLAHATEPNRVWCADYKGWFLCANGERCDPLTATDACSRYLLCCRAVAKTDEVHTRAVFEAMFREHGLPDAIRTDNGTPFASPAPGGLSRLAIYWLRLGIRHERIDPGCPEQNGRHERMHLTLKQATASPPAANLRRQQERFVAFEREYNEQRPHQALAYRTPASVYVPSPRSYPRRLPEIEYSAEVLVRQISRNGYFSWKHEAVFVSEVLAGENIGLMENEEGLYEVYFGPLLLGWFDAVERVFAPDRGPRRR